MAKGRDPILIFLADMGIEGEITTSNILEPLIAIPTEQFKQNRKWVETWFIVVEQGEDFCYLRERLRGTGDTL